MSQNSKFCCEIFLDNAGGSKTIRREKGEKIVKMLKHPNGDEYSAKVKQISSYVLPCAWIC